MIIKSINVVLLASIPVLSVMTPSVYAIDVPARVEAESYSAQSGTTTYTTTSASGGKYVGNYAGTDWSDYTINVTAAGTYNIDFRVASQNANTQLQLKNGTTILATVDVGNTGGWEAWTTVTKSVNLTAGLQTWRIANSGAGSYPNLDYFEVKPNGGALGFSDLKWALVDDDNPYCIDYVGTWNIYNGNPGYRMSEHYSSAQGSTATFNFIGTKARYYGFKRSDLGVAEIYVNGKYIQDVDCYSATSQYNVLLYETDALPMGANTLEVRQKSTKQIIVDAFWTDLSVRGSIDSSKLPSNIRPVVFGAERTDWNINDSSKICYVNKAGGEAFEMNIYTGETRSLTRQFQSSRPSGWGYYRVLYLPNGDYLLTGGPSRGSAYLQILDKSLTKAPKVFSGVVVKEGPAVARNAFKIAYTPDQSLGGIRYADIVYTNGEPFLQNDHQIISSGNVLIGTDTVNSPLEPQNFRPPLDDELTWTSYSSTFSTAHVVGYSFSTNTNKWYYKDNVSYDEPEGIFPDGKYTCVESDLDNLGGTGHIDIYALKLDGSFNMLRLTYFNSIDSTRKAGNPVISDDGKYMGFQEEKAGDGSGVGRGIYIYNLNYTGSLGF